MVRFGRILHTTNWVVNEHHHYLIGFSAWKRYKNALYWCAPTPNTHVSVGRNGKFCNKINFVGEYVHSSFCHIPDARARRRIQYELVHSSLPYSIRLLRLLMNTSSAHLPRSCWIITWESITLSYLLSLLSVWAASRENRYRPWFSIALKSGGGVG